MISKLVLIRKWFTETSTIGELYVNDAFFCYTLEDVARATGVKIKGNTCIPEGEYELRLTRSERFNRVMPLIFNRDDLSVQDIGGAKWTGIRIHAGNTIEDTDGCLLLGKQKGINKVIDSVKALDEFYTQVWATISGTETLHFTIKNKQENV